MTNAKNQARQRVFGAALLCAQLGACNSSSSADQPRSLTEVAGFTTRVGDPKPFVVEARPPDPQFLPVGVSVTRDAPRKTIADFKTIEQSLDAAKGSNESAGAQARTLGATPPPLPPPAPPPL